MQRSMAGKQGIFAKGVGHLGDTVMFFGVLGIILGWFLIVGMISPTVGIAVGLAGITTVMLGFLGKHARALWHRFFD